MLFELTEIQTKNTALATPSRFLRDFKYYCGMSWCDPPAEGLLPSPHQPSALTRMDTNITRPHSVTCEKHP